jgi:predicted DNA-binding transcriptional regulator AlpA
MFLQHPVAWTHAQHILDAEAVMLQRGLGENERVAFLTNELQRYLDQCEVSIAELFTAMFTDLTKQESIIDFETIRLRFEGLGFTGTLRQIRNLNRRLGNIASGIDQVLFWGGLAVTLDQGELIEVAERLFKPRVEQLLSHPTSAAAEQVYNGIMSSQQLLSARDSQAQQLALDTFSEIVNSTPSFLEYSSDDKRDFVLVCGRILDVQFVDIMLALISNGGVGLVRKYLLGGIDASTTVYRRLITTLVENRIASISPSTFTSPVMKETTEPVVAPPPLQAHSDMLTADEVMAKMKISRSMLFRLGKKKLLMPVKIGRVNRYDRKDVDKYLGIE